MILITKPFYRKSTFLLLLSVFGMLITFQACKKSKSDVGQLFYLKTKNKIFKDITAEGFADAFKKLLAQNHTKLSSTLATEAFYKDNDYEPVFLINHFANNDLHLLTSYYQNAKLHGLNPNTFHSAEIDSLVSKLSNKNGVKTLDEAYQDMAKLEWLTANTFVSYSNAMQFGVISPRRIYARYFTHTLRPDSASVAHALRVANIKLFLDSVQPGGTQYVALQKALNEHFIIPGLGEQQTERILKVNLERLRWKNKPAEDRYVIVNIPDYQLNVMDHGKSILNMKVCVGEGRNKDNTSTLVEYDDSNKIDRPFLRETPQLNSVIYAAQVNPVWNIPESIANKEILVEAAKDPYYLSNKNIDVYKNGKKVADPETIKWAEVGQNSDYSFKQQPGKDNSLGKIKFIFENASSVYLHDTPAKLAFQKAMRAVSHGCVRLEKPLDFAHTIFGDGEKYDMIAKFMAADKPDPTTINLPQKMPIYITYVTCWADENGTLQYRPDVYGLDIVLFAQMSKYIW